jgi:hypothetical protein
MPTRDPLDIIEYAESKGKNIPNYKFGPGFTAQGYYQITDPTWRDHAKAAGVDLGQYPTAMSAPKEVQRAVAEQIFEKRGFQPWEAVKHLRGQEASYGAPSGGLLAAGGTPAAKTTTIADLQKQLLERYPELKVTSGYRDPAHNAKVGGAKNSQHTHGTAIDVSLKGLDEARQREIVDYARQLGARGLGYYPNSQSAHFDVRQGAPAVWGQNYSRTSLPQTPSWFQEVAEQHMKSSGTPQTQTAQAPAPTQTTTQTAQTDIPTRPENEVQALIAQTTDPWKALEDAQKEQQARQLMAQARQAQPQPPEPAPAPPPAPAAPPADYSALLMPRLRRGLLADRGFGLLG